MKHVWIINQFANSPEDSAGIRHYSLSKYLVDHDWSATIITGSIQHNTGLQRLKINEKIRIKKFNKVCFFWINLKKYKVSKLKNRVVNMFFFLYRLISIRFLKYLEKPKVVIGSTISPLAALGAYLISLKYNVPFIYEIRDLWPETLIEMKVISSNGIVSIFLKKLDLFLAKRSKKIIVLMPGGIEYYKKLGIKQENIIWLSNGVDKSKNDYFQRKKVSYPFNLIYLGSHGPSNSLETIIFAMNYLKKLEINPENVLLRLIGDGSQKLELMRLCNDLGLENVIFEDPISTDKVKEKLKSADGLIVAMNNLPGLYKYGISFNKLFEYLLSGRPILMTSCTKNNYIKVLLIGDSCFRKF